MNIEFLKLDTTVEFDTYSDYLKLVSKERISKINRFKTNDLKIVSLFAELLIKEQISAELSIPWKNIQFEYNTFGKPSLKSNPDYYFSISHCKNCIAFISDISPIGIDIEQIKTTNLNIAKRFFTTHEYQYIFNSNDTISSFFEIWTKKEAYIKMLGVGLSKPLNSFDVLNPNLLDVNFHNILIDNFQLSICHRKLIKTSYDINIINSNELIAKIMKKTSKTIENSPLL